MSEGRGKYKKLSEEITRMLCSWKEVEVLQLGVQAEQVQLVCSIPSKESTASGGVSSNR